MANTEQLAILRAQGVPASMSGSWNGHQRSAFMNTAVGFSCSPGPTMLATIMNRRAGIVSPCREMIAYRRRTITPIPPLGRSVINGSGSTRCPGTRSYVKRWTSVAHTSGSSISAT